MSKNTGTSELINYFDLGANGDVGIAGSLDINTIANATTDTDTFLVSDTGIIKYRTGAQLLSDIGAQGLLTNPVTGTGTSGTIPVFTGSTTIGNSIIQSNSTQVNIVGNGSALLFDSSGETKSGGINYINSFELFIFNSRGTGSSINLGNANLDFNTNTTGNPRIRITNGGNVLVNSTSDNGARLQVSGTATVSGELLVSRPAMTSQADFTYQNIRVTTGFGGGYTDARIQSLLAGYDGSTIHGVDIGYSYDSPSGAGYSLRFATNDNTSGNPIERLRINSVGKVIINDTVGDTLFNINTKSSSTYNEAAFNGGVAGIRITNGSQGQGRFSGITFGGGGNTEGFFGVVQNASNLAEFAWQTYNGSAYGERMRITSGGNVLIGTTTDSGERMQVRNGLSLFELASGTNGAILKLGRSAGAYYWHLGISGATSNFTFYDNNLNALADINVSTGAYTALSDINKKKDFEESTIGLNAILGLKPTLYRMKSETNTQKHLGFIAQEVRQYIPNAYVENGEFIGLNEMPIIAALTKAIQELKQQLDTLTNENN